MARLHMTRSRGLRSGADHHAALMMALFTALVLGLSILAALPAH